MQSATFASEAANEANHWWFVGRRRLFIREIRAVRLPVCPRVLDIGTSTGTNLRMLRDIGLVDVTGLDLSPEAIAWCQRKGLGEVKQGDICDMPFATGKFDLVLATDIIEHVEDDSRALEEVVRVLRPGGIALVTVPAFSMIWGLQDRVAQHKRRYLQRDLNLLLSQAGLIVEKSYYFNYLLFLPILLARRIIDRSRIQLESEAELNSPVLNWLLDKLFTLDVLSAPHLRPPFGVSILAIARKPPHPDAKRP